MKMKELFCLSFLALLLLSCVDEHGNDQVPDNRVFTATIADESLTKTLLGNAEGGKRRVFWEKGDEIRIGAASYVADSVSTDGLTATFSGKNATKDGNVFKAYYPAAIHQGGHLQLPRVQRWRGTDPAKGLLIASDLPMYAESPDNALVFQNICAVLVFRITGLSSQKVDSIVVTSKAHALWGPFVMNDSAAKMTGDGPDYRKLLFDCGAGVTLHPSDETEFLVAIPQGTYETGDMRVVFYEGNKELFSMDNGTGDMDIVRSTMYNIVASSAPAYSFTVSYTDRNVSADGVSGQSFSVSSSKSQNGQSDPEPWIAEFSTDGGATWSREVPAWLEGFPSGDDGNVGEERFTYNVKKLVYGRTSPEWGGSLEEVGGGTGRDLSLYDVYGLPFAQGRNTANCYVVSAPGHYKFPAVYGNAIRNDSDNNDCGLGSFVRHDDRAIQAPWIKDNGIVITGAKLLWSDMDVIQADSVYFQDDFIHFSVEKDRIFDCNAVIAAFAGETIVWSWHIWITHDPANTLAVKTLQSNPRFGAYTGTVKVMPVNLGWVMPHELAAPERRVSIRFTQLNSGLSSRNYNLRQYGRAAYDLRERCTFYQWGRKDPLMPAFRKKGSKTFIDGSANLSWCTFPQGTQYTTVRETVQPSIGTGIQHPNVMYGPANRFMEFWFANPRRYDLWNVGSSGIVYSGAGQQDIPVVKSVYDPCPAGFRMPSIFAFAVFGTITEVYSDPWSDSYYLGTLNIENSSTVSSDEGYAFYLNGSDGETVYFPKTGGWTYNISFTEWPWTLYWTANASYANSLYSGCNISMEGNRFVIGHNYNNTTGGAHNANPVRPVVDEAVTPYQ